MTAQRLFTAMILLAGLVLTSTVSAQTDQQIRLIIPEALNLLYVDGKKHKNALFHTGDLEIDLAVGQHQLVFEYEEIWEDGDDHDRVISEPFMVTFSGEDDYSYRVKLPVLTTVNAAKAYAKLPSVTLVNHTSNQKIEADLSYQLEQQSFLQSFVKQRAEVVAADAQETDKGNAAPHDMDALKQLKQWWGKASQKERDKFLQWVRK